MAKAKPRTVTKARRMFLENPGMMDSVRTPDGSKTVWKGGDVGKVCDDAVTPILWMQNNGGLPFGIDWMFHCDDENVWYVRRIDDDPREVPTD